MYNKNAVDFNWSTAFNLKENEKRDIIRQIKSIDCNYDASSLSYLLGFDSLDEAVAKACEIAALRFCLQDSNFGRDFLSGEEYEKALNQFARKQYSSKLFKELLFRFCLVLSRYDRHKIQQLLKLDVLREAKVISDETAEKSFAPLKKVIDKITSGVKSQCYFSKEIYGCDISVSLNDDLNNFLIEKYDYDYKKLVRYEALDSERIFKKILLDDDNFWNEHERFGVQNFLDAVYKLNDERHAQKILSFIFDKIKEDEFGCKIIESKLPLIYLYKDRIFRHLKEGTARLFYRFNGIYDLDIIYDDICCYPYEKPDGIEEKIVRGWEIFEGLINLVYPSDSKKVTEFFFGQLNGEEPFEINGQHYTVKDLLYGYSTCHWYNEENRRAVTVYCPEYFDRENVFKRIYLVAYAADKLEKNTEKCYANLFEIFFDLFKVAEKKFGLKTSFQKDDSGREKAYGELKSLLEKYGVNISDKYKDDYITSLLDRKVASMEEIERFPALEQLGDAAYGFAVAELMFYQPSYYEPESVFKSFGDYVSAYKQIEIARKIGFDKLYLSPLTLSCKFSRDTFVDPDDEMFLIRQEREDGAYKFLADSLEMVIGTICSDCGYQAAIDFTKRIFKETFTDVCKEEVRWENRYEADGEQEIDREYWNRIMPQPSPNFEDYSSKEYIENMWLALNKFMLAYSVGTEEREERKFLTNRYSNVENGDEIYGTKNLRQCYFNPAMYDYLHGGLARFIESYSDRIKANYKKLKDEK